MSDTSSAIEATIISPTGLIPESMDRDALWAVHKLQERGYEAYLVGGCIRDLLLSHQPKDWDIATSARPPSVKRSFPRNCRIIGRRFKLAHLHFNRNQKILEVSTFRRPPSESEGEGDGDNEDLLITQDNEFGTAEEDALRRDFTINALFLDPVRDRILDYADGLSDLRAGVIRCIGDPFVRFHEDPVRILRAAKFCGRLGFTAEPETHAAMVKAAPDLVRAAKPRLLEEILRLLRGGHSLRSFQMLRDVGALPVILPLLSDYLEQADRSERVVFWRMLEALDNLVLASDEKPSGGLLLGALFARPVLHHAAGEARRSLTSLSEELITPFAAELRLPRRDAGCLKRICAVQQRFGRGGGRFKISSFLQDPYFLEALQLFELTCAATGEGREDLIRWQRMAGNAGTIPSEEAPAVADDRGSSRSKDKKKSKKKDKGRGKDRDKQQRRKEKDGADKSEKKAKSKKKNRREREAAKVQTLEPEAIDLSAFDMELNPKSIPSFGTIVEGTGKKKRKASLPAPEDDVYKPPPPPGSGDDAGPPPPPPAQPGGEFGDW